MSAGSHSGCRPAIGCGGTAGGGEVRVLDPDRERDWPVATPPGVRRYLSAIVREGPARLLRNAPGVRAEILRVGETVLPVLVCDGRPGVASMLSILGQLVHYPAIKVREDPRSPADRLLARLAGPIAGAFRLGGVDRMVIANHWLMIGQIEVEVAPGDWPRIVDFLARRHPGHAIVVEDIDPARTPGLAQGLLAAGGRSITTRLAHLYDPAMALAGKAFSTIRANRSKARRLFAEAGPDLLPAGAVARQCDRMAELYRACYIDRHSALNPDYTPAFFRLALSCPEFRVFAWRRPGDPEGRLAAFNLQRIDGDTISWTAYGRDLSIDPPYCGSHYELAAASDMEIGRTEGLVCDWGSGSDSFKSFRGTRRRPHFKVVFTDHLPPVPRATWNLFVALRRSRSRTQGWPDQMSDVLAQGGKDG